MMRRILLTGINGTVAPVVAKILKAKGSEIQAWDRTKISENDLEKSIKYLNDLSPNKVFHFGFGPVNWAELMACWCKKNKRRFIFTSTASVFSMEMKGPFTINHLPDSKDDYGKYKYSCEKAITRVNTDALIVRLGWQIGHCAGNNNMFDFFEKESHEGQLELSEPSSCIKYHKKTGFILYIESQ